MRSFIKELLILLALVTLGSAYSLWSGLAPLPWSAPEIEAGAIRVEDARVLEPVWVDTRSREDFDARHIPGAVWLSEDAWDAGLVELMDLWLSNPRPIVVYCSSASCGTSKQVADRLRTALTDAEIYTLHGGWEAWTP